LCLCGFPFSSGFFSKDFILDGANLMFWIFFLFIRGVIFTFAYSIRFAVYSIISLNKQRRKVLNYYDNLFFLLGPIWILILLALISGFLWREVIYLFSSLVLVRAGWKFIYWNLVLIIINFVIYLFKNYYFFLKKYFLRQMSYLNRLFTLLTVKIFLVFSKVVIKVLDQGWQEQIGPSGILKARTYFSYRVFRQVSYSFVIGIFFFFFFLI
jgi:hypothetical protein